MKHQRSLVVKRLLAFWGVVRGGGLGGGGIPDSPICIEPTLGPGHLLAALVGAKDPAHAAEVRGIVSGAAQARSGVVQVVSSER